MAGQDWFGCDTDKKRYFVKKIAFCLQKKEYQKAEGVIDGQGIEIQKA